MSRDDELRSRTHMTPRERQLRSALNQILCGQGVIHGSLITRRKTCGKSGCRCTKGQLHESLYLVVTEGNESRQLYVPRSHEALVRQWIERYGQARELLDELSGLHWDKIRQRQD